jgi:hypothetical protein
MSSQPFYVPGAQTGLRRQRSVALTWFLRLLPFPALAFLACGLAGLPWPWPERADAEVLIVAALPQGPMCREAEKLREQLQGKPGVHSVVLRTGMLAADEVLDDLCDRARPRMRPHPRMRLVVLLRPLARDTRPGAWAQRAACCRRLGISVGTVVVPREALPGALATLPTRTAEIEKGRFGTFSVLLRNLDRLADSPDELKDGRLEVVLHGASASWSPAAVQRELEQVGAELGPAGTSAPTRLTLPLDRLAATEPGKKDEQWPAARMLCPLGRKDLLAGPVDGVEVVLSKGAEVIERTWLPVNAVPPRVLYVPLAAGADDPPGPPFPRLLQRTGEGMSRADRVCWNLLWQEKAAAGGVEVVRPGVPTTRSTVTDLPVTSGDLAGYRAVVLDASVPRDRDADLELTATPSGAGHAWGKLRYYPGFLVRNGPGAAERKKRIEGFLEALSGYWKQGGTVLLVGGHPGCLDSTPPPPDVALALNLRGVVERYFDPALGKFEAKCFPRRLVLAHDDTEAALRRTIGTLPPLPAGDGPPASQPFLRWQLRTWLGPDAPADRVPGRALLAKAAAGRLGLLAGPTQGDQELAVLLRDELPDSIAELAAAEAWWLAGTFAHPGLAVEVQGVPAFRRGHPPFDKFSVYPEGKWTGFDLPFPRGPDDAGPVWRDRYATLFRRLEASSPRAALEERPDPASGFLVDGLNADRFLQYLREQSSAGTLPAEKTDPGRGRDVVLALLARQRFEEARMAGRPVGWGLLNGSVPALPSYPRKERPFLKAPVRARHHFLLLGPGSGSLDALAAKAFEPAPRPKPGDWWLAGFDPFDAASDHAHRLLFMGRGRFHQLLTTAMARDLQALPCAATASLTPLLRGRPEVHDILRRILHERLRLSMTPVHRPPAGWRALVECRDGADEVPVVIRAEAPGRGHLLMALFDPEYEADLHDRRDAALLRHRDHGATTAFAGDVPVRGAFGATLTTRGGEGGNLLLELKAHPLREDPPYLMEEAPLPALDAEVTVRVHPRLGLTGPGSSWMTPHPASAAVRTDAAPFLAPGSPVVRELLDAGGSAPAGVGLSLAGPGAVLVVRPEELGKAAVRLLGSPGGAALFPQELPLLLEVRVKATHEGRAGEVSVFAPVPPRYLPIQEQNHFYGISLDHAPPAVQAIDLLLEALGKPATYRVQGGPDGRSFRVAPTEPGTALPGPGGREIVEDRVAGPLVPAGDLESDDTLPGQRTIRLRPDSAHLGRRLRVTLTSPGGRREVHRVHLPGPKGEGPLVSLGLHDGGGLPREEDLVIDTLGVGTIPETLRRALEDRPRDQGGWTAAERGTCIDALLGGDRLAGWLADFIDLRTKTNHPRSWFLASLLALVLGWATRRIILR